MLRLSLTQALAHRSRLALTLLAVVLGVTFVAGSLVLTDTSQQLFDDQFRTANAGVDLTVRDAVAFDSAMGVEVERDPLPADLAERAEAVTGVADALPVADGQGLLQVGGEAVVPSGPSLLTSWAPEPFGAFALRTGTAPRAQDEVVIDAATARQHDIEVGDVVTVVAHHTAELRVVGLAGFGDRDGLPNSTVALVNMPAAQSLLGLGDRVSEVRVVAEDDVATQALRDRLSAELGSDVDVAAGQDTAAASAAAAKTQLSYLRVMLLSMSAAALLVGAVLIANTFSVVVSQRTRELAVLRAAGATGRQVVGSVLGEALLVGLVGGALGTLLGVASAVGLRDVAGGFGVALPDGALVVAPRTVALALGIAVLVTVTSALGPARRAARVAPVEAMRQSAATSVASGKARTVVGIVLAASAAAALAAADVGAPIALVGVAALLAVVGLALLGPVVVPWAARQLGRPLDAAGAAGRLARGSAARAPRRTAATTMALALGLSLISFLTIVGTSVKESIAGTYDEVITADYVIESARAEMLGGLSPVVYERVRELPEVAVASRLRYGHWMDGTTTSALTAVDPATLDDVASVDLVAGSLEALDGGGVILSDKAATERGLSVGDTLPMTFSRTGQQRLPIVGLVEDSDAQALSTSYLVSLDTFARQFSEDVDASVFLRTAQGVDAGAARAAIDAAIADQPTADVRDEAAAVAGRTATVDQILGLVTVLLLLAVLIALLGITNTLALSIVERTREIGLLRAVGMTRGQLRWMVRAEAVLVSGLAVVLGLTLGGAFGAATVVGLGRAVEAGVVVPVGQLLLVVAIATSAGLLAGLLPARRAGRLDVLNAIATE
jgi:putative ABC transport system permease protein